MFQLAHAKSYYSRSDQEVWAALSASARKLYLKLVSERRGFFIVWDTTTVALVPNTEEYALPATCRQLIRVREQTSSSAPWRVVEPADINDPDFTDAQFNSVLGPNMDGPVSEFEYYTYILNADAQSGEQERIRFEPPPYDNRNVELVYVASYVEITNATSANVIPQEGHDAQLYHAVAQLLADNGDDPSAAAASAEAYEIEFLKWARARQAQTAVTHVQPYIDDLD